MVETMQLRTFTIAIILLVLFYTLNLVRTNRLSAHLAISWIIAEVAFLILMLSDHLWSALISFLGEDTTSYGAFLLGAVWIVFLMLDSLTRISSLTTKLKEVNQELALARERLDRLEEMNRSLVSEPESN